MNWPAFANPWMLAGLAAVGLPLLIHWLTRARPRPVAFPPFKFLVEACAGQQAVHRLRTIALLTVRCLLVLAVALMFARPFFKPGGAPAAADANKRVVLVLDASLSMRAIQQGVPLFARAQAEAADVLRDLEAGGEAAVILAGAAPRALLPALSRNVPALHEALLKAQPTYEAGDFAAALAEAKRLLGGGGAVYIFSDFQKSNWEAVRELPAGLICRLRPVTTEPVPNVALAGARFSPGEPVAGEPVEIVLTVFNCTPRPREEIVRLELGERPAEPGDARPATSSATATFAQERRVAVPAFGTGEAAFTATLAREGVYTGKASLQADDLPADNTRHLVLRAHKAFQVLLVSDADSGDQRSAAFFVQRALAPSPRASPGLNIVRRHSQDTDRGMLETADLFVLAAPAMLSGEAVEIIARRVQEGARLMAMLDGPSAPLLMPAALQPPFQLQQVAGSGPGDAVAPGPLRLSEFDAADWSAARFRRHFRTQVLPGREGEVMLAFDDGSAALTLSPAGKGAAAFLNLPLTPESGDFVGSPLFPVTLHELLRLLRRGSETRPVTPGAGWVLEALTQRDGALAASDPAGQPVAGQVLASGRTTRLAMPPARLPGLFMVSQGGAVVGAEAVNIDPRESDTRPLALEQFKPGAAGALAVVHNEEDLLLAGKSRPLWPHLAAAVAALLGLEMLLLALWRPWRARATPAPARPAMNLEVRP